MQKTNDYAVLRYKKEVDDFFDLEQGTLVQELHVIDLLVKKENYDAIYESIDRAVTDWITEFPNSILLSDELTEEELSYMAIGDYVIAWLDKEGYQFGELRNELVHSELVSEIPTLKEIAAYTNYLDTINAEYDPIFKELNTEINERNMQEIQHSAKTRKSR